MHNQNTKTKLKKTANMLNTPIFDNIDQKSKFKLEDTNLSLIKI